MSKSVIACDLGTGSTKAALYTVDGECVAECTVAHETFYPAAGFHEQRPADWWNSVCESVRQLISLAGEPARSAGAISLSGQSLGCLPLSASGQLLQEQVPIWSDGRAQAEAAEFFEGFERARWYHRTGNGFPAPLYPVFKLMWLRRHRPEVFEAAHVFIGSKDYINYRLTGVLATDHSYASGSGAYDLRAGDYADDILQAAGLRRAQFPGIVPSMEVLGEVRPDVCASLGLRGGAKVVAGGVDNSCMALGARTFEDGDIYGAMGSSSWLTVCSREPITDDAVVPFVFAHVVPGMFISATSTFSAGTSLRWVVDLLDAPGASSLTFDALEALVTAAPPGANGLIFVPTLGGGTSFEGGPEVRGAFVGLDLRHRRSDVVRATLEGVAMALGIALEALRRITSVRGEIVIVGGGARGAAWRQIFAEAWDCTVLKTNIDQQAATLGAAALAFVGIGQWDDFSRISTLHTVQARHVPEIEPALRATMRDAYRQAAHQQRDLSPALARLRRASTGPSR